MSGFSTTWTAAVWMTRPWMNDTDSPSIGVVNRGTDATEVTISWFNDGGTLLQEDTFKLGPNDAARRILFYENAPNTTGWARVVSDQPLAPWGITPYHLYVRIWANMEFYGENVVPLDDARVSVGNVEK